jgi:Flp pilus assembly protein TadD
MGLGVFWYFLMLAPTSSVIPLVDPMAEHRVYLANFGLMLAGVVAADWGFSRAWDGRVAARAGVALGVVVSVALCAALVARNRLWHDELALWTDAADKAPLHYRPQLQAGNALWAAGAHDDALRHFARVAELVTPRSEVWAAMQGLIANRLSTLGRLAEARVVLDGAVSVAPGNVALREALAWNKYSVGDFDGALVEVASGRRLGKDSAELAAVAGKTAASRGDYATALRELQRAVALAPLSPLRRSDLAIVSKMAGRDREACDQIGVFSALEPDAQMRAEGIKLRIQWNCSGP